MSVPALAVAGAVLAIDRSAVRDTVVVAVALLLRALVSSPVLVAVTVAVLATGPVAVGLMCTTMSKLAVALGESAPTLQLTVPAVLVQPTEAETKLTCAGRGSLTVPPLEVDGPLLVTVR